ncbi:aromatic ring-hydroxylating dioxygenase subunit alpha [Xinfangfangia sp. CPCC 101601]|uniref:Aromatic ring-hydroxylating dioxygenase subunit alpha n=1 Tax=Pseudogemmobacter lacusdianii TaxID=3069608 RepID=A0ABU0VXV8_9RHOB|nr:aromatic ring-hydroxylating dioxygenase subunit alpha [Xinfangfangia sp. CPCC 101601]MDQ2066596.1 aromatic ring-hydroxylating dioxygenase subunit alpha [Xinfangfangia sp. CPCC 101601]
MPKDQLSDTPHRAILDLIEAHQENWSLQQPFYRAPEIFELERQHWFPRQWVIVAHATEMPEVGRYIIRPLFDEEIIIVRHGEGPEDIAAYYNVCTHRGSKLCTKDGKGRLLVCPYHAWSFRLTGELQTRADLPEGVDPEALGLHKVPVRIMAGLVLCGLGEGDLPDFAPVAEGLTGLLQEHGVDKSRIIARKSYPTKANWKLVMENFLECYHCRPAHPEYFRVNGHTKVTAMRNEAAAQEWQEEIDAWHSVIGDAEFNKGAWEAGNLTTMPFAMHRKPIGQGRVTLSDDGQPVSKLMGGRTQYDGSESGFRIGRLSFISAANDYLTMFQMIPRGPHDTDVIITWLVAEDAPADVEADKISWMWDVTTVQDKKITEDNADGIASRSYRPGPYTPLESQTAFFVETYLAEMRSLLTGEHYEVAQKWSAPSELFASPEAACSNGTC